jgi:hypothetical protein
LLLVAPVSALANLRCPAGNIKQTADAKRSGKEREQPAAEPSSSRQLESSGADEKHDQDECDEFYHGNSHDSTAWRVYTKPALPNSPHKGESKFAWAWPIRLLNLLRPLHGAHAGHAA